MSLLKTETLSSDRNTLLKEVRRAVARGTLTSDGYAVAESFHLLEEAVRSRCRMKAVIVDETVLGAVEAYLQGLSSTRVISVDAALFSRISATEASQGVIALVQPPSWKMEQLFVETPLLVVLDGVQDPGNGGAVVRAAEAFGATGAVFLKGSVNPFNPKALRASAGSLFRLPVVAGADPALLAAALEQNGVEMFAAGPRGGKAPADADLRQPAAIVIGSEGRGISEAFESRALRLTIPTTGVESLNAAMAAGVLLYEAHRQRRPHGTV
jgi:RNA methyltransferase, TrmH family